MSIRDDLEHDEHQADEHDGRGSSSTSSTPGTPPPDKKKAERRQQAIIGLSFVGVIIAYLTYRSRAAASSASTSLPTSPYLNAAGQQAALGAGQVAGAGDGSATSGFQAYLDNLSGEIAGLQSTQQQEIASIGALSSHPTPAPTGPPKVRFGAAARGLKYIRSLGGTGIIYQVQPDGSFAYVTQQQYAALGKPGYTGYGAAPKPPPRVPGHGPAPVPHPVPRPA